LSELEAGHKALTKKQWRSRRDPNPAAGRDLPVDALADGLGAHARIGLPLE
jgi:hypothetical protein